MSVWRGTGWQPLASGGCFDSGINNNGSVRMDAIGMELATRLMRARMTGVAGVLGLEGAVAIATAHAITQTQRLRHWWLATL